MRRRSEDSDGQLVAILETTPVDRANRTPAVAWHAAPIAEVVEQLGADTTRGLAKKDAADRLQRYGKNVLDERGRVAWPRVLLRQFADILIVILLIAAAIAAAIGETGDAVTILAIVVLNGVLGFVQEWKAERALEALRHMLSPRCRVVRDGGESEIDAAKLVQGDLVRLEIGDRVPADLRLTEALNLKADEAALTGESAPRAKTTGAAPEDAPLAERRSMAWTGTAVTNGRGTGIVVATGMETEFGRIARLTQTVGRETTPLQRKLAVLGRQLGILSVVTAAAVTFIGWIVGKPAGEMFLTGVALAVAVVPEGLPAVVTITLALGIRSMYRRRALLRRLQAAEALGAASTICCDKTGTLTRNEMTVQRVWLAADPVDVTGSGYDPAGHFEQAGARVDYRTRPDLLRLLRSGLECNNSHVQKEAGAWQEIGEPTEAALVVAAYKAWLHPEDHEHTITEFSFNSNRKRMTTVVHRPDGMFAYVKGAPEVILDRSTRLLVGETERELTAEDRRTVLQAVDAMGRSGLRTLALADRQLPDAVALADDAVESDLTLLGIVGIIDPPRDEVPAAIRTARAAGIRTIMITGDAAVTALTIGQRVGLAVDRAVTGRELDALDDESLAELLTEPVLFARTTPEHKLRIVHTLQAAGEVVAMTGDGVNDAPALKQADIGIAMGIRGTDVARGAADIVLTDDNFSSIVSAVEEGRRQYDNIQKFVRYLLSSNTGEVLAITANILLGGPLLLLPVQILWMNLVTDGMTAVALGMEPVEGDVMRRPPRAPGERILDRTGIFITLALGGWIAAGTLWLFHAGGRNPDHARTIAFVGIVMIEKANVFNFRSLRQPLFAIGLLSNRWLLFAWCATVGLQVAAVYAPGLQEMLHTVPLSLTDWAMIAVVAAPIFLATEALKWLRMRRTRDVGGHER